MHRSTVMQSSSVAAFSSKIQLQTKYIIQRISYEDLLNQTPEAIACAKEAFCKRSSYGALQISNIPNWKTYREEVMKQGKKLALDPGEGKKMREECRGDFRVGPGWMGSPGEETHSLQSGFYADMKKQRNNKDSRDDKEGMVNVWGANRWPAAVDATAATSFEESITSAAELMYKITLLTLDLAQKAAAEMIDSQLHNHCEEKNVADGKSSTISSSSYLPNLRQMAESSEFLPARLVYYDADFSREDNIMKNDSRQYWLPWHVDFNMATAFAPAMWIDEVAALNGDRSEQQEDANPEHESGLLLRNPEGKIIPAAIGDDCILVQLGAHSQLATGGLLKAGPHAVGKIDSCKSKKEKEDDDSSNRRIIKHGRLSFGLFVYGPWKSRMKPSDDLLHIIGAAAGSVVEDDFGCLMEKAYTGDTVLEGYKKFESYMNGV